MFQQGKGTDLFVSEKGTDLFIWKSGADTTINAGRDVNLVSAEQVINGERGLHHNETVTQYGSTVDAGQSLTVNAGRDISAIASQIDAKRDVSMSAIGDLTLSSAADEQHAYSRKINLSPFLLMSGQEVFSKGG